ncbi:MAG: S-adenosylmethionine decarboxylase [Bacteroidia bacterium]|nr:S-adenosylmethionine decarboxylase [Bacteroidia bacterium]
MAEASTVADIWNRSFWIGNTEPAFLRRQMEGFLDEAGFTRLGFNEHHFSPQGYTALWLLGESHLAVHTFPERAQTYVELSSCNAGMLERFMLLCQAAHQIIPHQMTQPAS